jgi:biopolymer transport protein ExbD
MLRRRVAIGLLAVSTWGLGCDDKPAVPKPQETPAAATTTAPAPKPPPDPLADLTVDELGPFLQTHRVDMAAKDAEEKLKAIVGGLPVKQKVVPLSATRNAKTQYVGAVARALGEAGALEIDVKTPDRTGAQTVLKLVPQQVVSASTPDCSVVAMVKKDNTSAVWHLKGGTAAKFSKGLAGPDMSMTYDGMKEQMAPCSSTSWFLAGEENVIWGLVFDLGQIVAKADPPPKATSAVFLDEAPIAGRPVALARSKKALP